MPKRTQHKSKRISKLRQKNHSWKIFQINKQFKRKLRNLGLAFSVLVATAVVFGAIAVYRYLENPLVSASGAYPASSWDGQAKFNLMLLTIEDENNPLSPLLEFSVLSLDPQNRSLTVMTVPTTVVVDFPNYGREKLASVYALAALSREKQSLAYVQKSLANFLGIPFDGYVLMDRAGSRELENALGSPLTFDNLKQLLSPLSWPKIPALAVAARSYLRTNLAVRDLAEVAQYSLQVRFDKIQNVVITPELLVDRNNLETVLEKYFVDARVYEEGIKIVILNGTSSPGLAGRVGRLIEHIGGNIIDLGNTTNYFEQSLLIGKNSGSYTVERLSTIFNIRQFRDPASFSEDDPLQIYLQRGDLILVAGLDISGSL
ncbi:MAG: LytR C-terminal domain-containing protein [Patescibacteria group bacterium]